MKDQPKIMDALEMPKKKPPQKIASHLPGRPLYVGKAAAEEVETLRLANLRLERLSIRLLVGFFVWSLFLQVEWVAPGTVTGGLFHFVSGLVPSVSALAEASSNYEFVFGVAASSWIFVVLSLSVIVLGEQLPTRAAVALRNLGWMNLIVLTVVVLVFTLLSTAFLVWLPIGRIDLSHLPTKGDVILALTLRSRIVMAMSTTAISAYLIFFYFLSIGLAFACLFPLACGLRSRFLRLRRRDG